MKDNEKKTAIAAYKERKIVGGIYLVRCTASGEIWVGQSPNPDAMRNRIWFTLRLGTNPCQGLQECWRQYGQENFQFEILERLDEEVSAYLRNARFKERVAHWRSELDAASI